MSQLINTYESLLLSNLSAVQSVESGLRNITWLLPGRFEDAELASEGLYALLNLVAGYHDSLLSRHISPIHTLPPHPFSPSSNSSTSTSTTSNPSDPSVPSIPRLTPLLPRPTDHTRYTRYWTSKSTIYRRASRALATLGYVQLLIEMVVKRRAGERARWRTVVWIEGLKTVFKLLILRVTKRPVLSPSVPQREYDPSSLPISILQPTSTASTKSSSPSTSTQPTSETWNSTGQVAVLPLMPTGAPLRSHLYSMIGAMDEEHLQHPLTLLPPLQNVGEWSAELIQCSLGLIHVLLLIRASKHPTPSTVHNQASLPSLSRYISPFIIPLSLALLARRLRTPPRDDLLLAEHYTRQDKQLAWRTLLSGPIWIGWTRPKVLGIAKVLEKVPLIGLLGQFVEGYLPLVDDYHYYTST
ncbi:peroxisome membrane protein [Naematelia encephala]|uniref:Peroxisomal membrane protein PEX16 n=1 Tax=Naematelia encephala TaxID=71784 RepID=A0A1Y2BL04_9TREE|nr:peroxisome membrane protein [Naematelia encephala]